MAYTIILVDDEDEVRGRIASKIIDQEAFEVIGSASNGYDALELLEEVTPDVVITDIKMPFVDGIELTRVMRERFPTVKVAIISGYDDYSYLKEAINLDVVAYLSKPIIQKNVDEFIEKIKVTLDEENKHVQLKEGMLQNQIRQRIIGLYLNDYPLTDEDEGYLAEVGIDIKKSYMVISTRLLNVPGGIIESEKKKNQSYLMIEELTDAVFNAYHIVYGQDIVSIIEVSGELFHKELDILLYKVMNYFKKYLNIDIAMGVSSADVFTNLVELYRQSQLTLEEYGENIEGAIHYFGDLSVSPVLKTLNAEEINECKKNMRYMEARELAKYIEGFTKKIKQDHTYDYFSVIVALSGLLIEYANSVGANSKLTFDINTIRTYIESRNIDGFMVIFLELTNLIRAEVLSKKTKKSVLIMTNILGYIEQNYSNADMSMDMVCDYFHISVSYLSTLFKRETETTFNKYLVGKRIEHAKMLLQNTDDKMVNIAEKCGYKDVYYFSHSFKKSTGQSPKEFRKK